MRANEPMDMVSLTTTFMNDLAAERIHAERSIERDYMLPQDRRAAFEIVSRQKQTDHWIEVCAWVLIAAFVASGVYLWTLPIHVVPVQSVEEQQGKQR